MLAKMQNDYTFDVFEVKSNSIFLLPQAAIILYFFPFCADCRLF